LLSLDFDKISTSKVIQKKWFVPCPLMGIPFPSPLVVYQPSAATMKLMMLMGANDSSTRALQVFTFHGRLT
jgi:hypothetical protein